MNYCSIQDAWGNENYISEQYKKYDNKDNIMEGFSSISNDDIKIENSMEKPNLNYSINDNQHYLEKEFTCDDFFDHIDKCSYCRMRIRKNISSRILEKLTNLVNDNRDTILLVLIILFFAIFLNLILSILRKK
jgi:hypothetical protein